MKAFRQRDLTRAIKGARQAGLSIDRVEIDKDGKIVVVSASDSAKPETPSEVAAMHYRKGKPWKILDTK